MIASVVFAFLHFVTAFGTAATLLIERVTLSSAPTYAEARRIQLADIWYGILGVLLAVVGALRVFLFEKGMHFYFGNPFFILKMILFFVVLGGLSVYPTVTFIHWRKETGKGLPPVVTQLEFKRLRVFMTLEIMVLLVIALCASLMAKGVLL